MTPEQLKLVAKARRRRAEAEEGLLDEGLPDEGAYGDAVLPARG